LIKRNNSLPRDPTSNIILGEKRKNNTKFATHFLASMKGNLTLFAEEEKE